MGLTNVCFPEKAGNILKTIKGKLAGVLANFTVIGILLLALVPQPIQAAPDAIVDLVLLPASPVVMTNTSFDVTVQAQCNGQPVAGISAFLNFDPAYLEVESITPGNTFTITLQNTFDNEAGRVDYSAGKTSDFPTGTFTLATVHFMTKDMAASQTAVSFHTSTGDPPLRDTRAVASGGSTVTRNLTGANVEVIRVDHLESTGASSTTAGVPYDFTVTAKNSANDTLADYRGTVQFASSDSHITGLPAPHTFTSEDKGVHTFTVTLKTAGTQTVTTTDTSNSSLAAVVSTAVSPAGVAHLVVSGIATPRTTGSAGSVTVEARDDFGNRATGYTGTIHFTSSDSAAILPADYTFSHENGGIHTFSNGITLNTSGTQSVTVTDTVNTAINGAQTGILTSAPAPAPAGGGGGGEVVPQYKAVTVSGLTASSDFKVNSTGLLQNAVQLKTVDGKATLDITPGTKLLKDRFDPVTAVTASIPPAPAAAPEGWALILAFSFGPEGANFNPAITLTMSYDPTKLPENVAEKDLYIAYYDGTKWQKLDSVIDTGKKTVSAKILHFSQYAIMGTVVVPQAPIPTSTPTPTFTPTPTPTPAATPVATTPSPSVASAPTPSATGTPTPVQTTLLTSTEKPANSPEQTQKAANNLPLVAGIAGAVIVVGLIMAVVVIRRRSGRQA
jgi:hypothetical protein